MKRQYGPLQEGEDRVGRVEGDDGRPAQPTQADRLPYTDLGQPARASCLFAQGVPLPPRNRQRLLHGILRIPRSRKMAMAIAKRRGASDASRAPMSSAATSVAS